MTGLSARNFRIAERGVLRAGCFADVVVFDPATSARPGHLRRAVPRVPRASNACT